MTNLLRYLKDLVYQIVMVLACGMQEIRVGGSASEQCVPAMIFAGRGQEANELGGAHHEAEVIAVDIPAGMLVGLNGPALADLIYDLSIGNSDISPAYTGPYGSVILHLESGVATLTFTANNGFRFGDGGFVDANFGLGFTSFASCTENNGGGTGFSTGICSNGGSQNIDGFGVFNQTTDNSDGFMDSAISAVLR